MLDIFLKVDTEKSNTGDEDVVVSGTILDKSCKIIFTGKALRFMSKIFIDTAVERVTKNKIDSVVSAISKNS